MSRFRMLHHYVVSVTDRVCRSCTHIDRWEMFGVQRVQQCAVQYASCVLEVPKIKFSPKRFFYFLFCNRLWL